jgi:dTDP-4-dehydrorhamnose reductase
VDSILVVGVETVVGANLAAHLAEERPARRVRGLTADPAVRITGCDIQVAAVTNAAEAVRCIEDFGATRVVVCGAAARSSWEVTPADMSAGTVSGALPWAEAARQTGCALTLISSDAVFAGPQMFHHEDCTSVCPSPQAQVIRDLERNVAAACPGSLIIRTNAFGWSPLGERGWVEQQLTRLRTSRLIDQDFIRHGTPILAVGLARVLHIAGAERVSPLKFVQRLAEAFHLPWLSVERGPALEECPTGFAAGECGLQTKQIRKAVCVAMPMLSEGLTRLVEQDANGFRQRLCGEATARNERAA